jgi:hypothetical protein
VIAADEHGCGLARTAYAGARRAVIPAFGIGYLTGVIVAAPAIWCAGAGAILGMAIGATVAIARRR